MKEILKEICGEEIIYIYGAGYVGRLLNRYLAKKGIEIDGFCVTHKDNNVVAQELKSVNREAYIIVAVTEQYRKEMIEYAREQDFIKLGVIYDEDIKIIKNEVEKKKLRFQTHLVEHCNLNCRGCYHFSSLAKEEYLSVSEYERDVKRLSELFDGKMEEVMLLGGEPLLHPQIDEFLKIARQYFKTGTICILTNGTLLHSMKSSFYEAILENDIELRVTKYPIKVDYDKIDQELKEKWGIQIYYFNKEPVRTLGHQPLDISGSRDFRKNFYSCYRANQCVDLKHGRLYPCIIPAEIKPFSEYFGLDIYPCDSDSVDIYSVDTGEELLKRLEKPIPFCRFCNRDDVQIFGSIPWSVTKHEIHEWTE